MSDQNRDHTRYQRIDQYHLFGLHNIPFVFKMFSILTCIQDLLIQYVYNKFYYNILYTIEIGCSYIAYIVPS